MGYSMGAPDTFRLSLYAFPIAHANNLSMSLRRNKHVPGGDWHWHATWLGILLAPEAPPSQNGDVSKFPAGSLIWNVVPVIEAEASILRGKTDTGVLYGLGARLAAKTLPISKYEHQTFISSCNQLQLFAGY